MKHLKLTFVVMRSAEGSPESGQLEDNRVGRDLPQPIVGLLVPSKTVEQRELEDRICCAGLIAVSREVRG